jgi:hypothetical protein
MRIAQLENENPAPTPSDKGSAGKGDASAAGPAKPEVLVQENILGRSALAAMRTLKWNTSAMVLHERYRASDRKVCPNRRSLRHPTKIHSIYRGTAAQVSPRGSGQAHPLGPTDCLPPIAANRMVLKPQSVPPGLAGGGSSAANTKQKR